MSLAAIATLAVSTGFAALCVWVLWPSNKTRLEDHGRIPLEEESARQEPDVATLAADAKDAQS